MELYVKVAFWMHTIGLGLRLLMMMGASYPRTTTYTPAADAALAIVGAAFAARTWWLVYGA